MEGNHNARKTYLDDDAEFEKARTWLETVNNKSKENVDLLWGEKEKHAKLSLQYWDYLFEEYSLKKKRSF